MSSRELVDELFGIVTSTDKDGVTWLESADFLPDRSSFNTALRGGDWSLQEYRDARIVNEIAASRADGRGYVPDFLRSPLELNAEREHDNWQISRHRQGLAELRGEG